MKHLTILASAMLSLAACSSAEKDPSVVMTFEDIEQQHDVHTQAFYGPLNHAVVWENSISGNGGTVRYVAERYDHVGKRVCRRFEETIRSTSDATETLRGTTCKLPGGAVDVGYELEE
jgi:surface antigen